MVIADNGITTLSGGELDYTGTAQILTNDPLARDLIAEVNLGMQEKFYIRPEFRLAYLYLTTGYMQNAINKEKKTLYEFLSNSVTSELLEEFSDI